MKLAEMMVKLLNAAVTTANGDRAAFDRMVDVILDDMDFRDAIISFKKMPTDLRIDLVDGSSLHFANHKWEVLA